MQAYPIAWAQGQGQTTHCQKQKKKKKKYIIQNKSSVVTEKCIKYN